MHAALWLKHKKVMALLAFISIRVTVTEQCVLLNVQSLSFSMQIGSKKIKIKVLQICKAHIKTTACVFMCISESTLSVSHSHSRILRDEILGGGGVSLTVAPKALAHGMGGKTNANVSQPTSTHV